MKNLPTAIKTKVVVAPDLSAPGFDLGSLLGYRLLRLSTSIGNLADREAKEVAGLSLPEYRVLVVLQSQGPSGVVALQQAMLIDKAWVSRTLTSLTSKALVLSEADPGDARRTVFSVTSKGKRAAEALIAQALKRQKCIMRGLDDQQTQQLASLLARIQENVDGIFSTDIHESIS